MKKSNIAFVLVLLLALIPSASGIGIGFSINNMQSEPVEGMNPHFTLIPSSTYSDGSGSRSITTSTPTQKEQITTPKTIQTQQKQVNTTPKIFHEEVYQEITVLPNEKKNKSLFSAVCFGVVFVIIIIFVGNRAIKNRQRKDRW